MDVIERGLQLSSKKLDNRNVSRRKHQAIVIVDDRKITKVNSRQVKFNDESGSQNLKLFDRKKVIGRKPTIDLEGNLPVLTGTIEARKEDIQAQETANQSDRKIEQAGFKSSAIDPVTKISLMLTGGPQEGIHSRKWQSVASEEIGTSSLENCRKFRRLKIDSKLSRTKQLIEPAIQPQLQVRCSTDYINPNASKVQIGDVQPSNRKLASDKLDHVTGYRHRIGSRSENASSDSQLEKP